jgi:cell division protein FtsB
MLNWNFRSSTAIRNTILALVLASVALIVHNVFGQNGYLTARRQQKELRQLQQHILQLQQENSQLEKQNQALKSDPEAIERKAREDMHLVKPGDKVYTLRDPMSANATSSADRQATPTQ